MKKYHLSPELEKVRGEIEEVCRGLGLTTSIDGKDTIFQVMDFSGINMVAAYTGFPSRYPHWKFGMEYDHMQKKMGWGFGRLYEMVINTSPPVAYLLEYNEPVQQKMVMAHVYAHVDFFANNYLFKETDSNMLNIMADHGAEIERYINRYGLEEVEKFIDVCLSIENLIDPYSVRMKREPADGKDGKCKGCDGSCGCKAGEAGRLPSKDYMDPFINPKEIMEAEREKDLEEELKEPGTPVVPQRDILKYLIDNSDHLKGWQRHILSIVRDESYYFAPQRQTKIINEGWATFWHSYVMSHLGYAGAEGIVGYARTHAGVVGMRKPGILTNPYTIGLMLFKYIKDSWDKGKHGPEYNKIKDIKVKKEWDTGDMKGMEKIFEARKLKNDIGFIREFMTPDFIRENELFIYKHDETDGTPRIHDRDAKKIRDMILHQLTNMGEPIIYIDDGNYNNRKEMLLRHDLHGYQLDIPDARRTMENIYKIWRRPTHLKTAVVHPQTMEHTPIMLSFDGQEHTAVKLEKDCGGDCSSCGGHK